MARRGRPKSKPANQQAEVVEKRDYVPSIPMPPEIENLTTIEVNGKKFTPLPDIKYANDYVKIYKLLKMVEIEHPEEYELVWFETWAELIKTDLFFVLFFVVGIPSANRPFVINACREVQEGQQSNTLDIWARYHFKAVDIEEPVPTPKGWMKHGDLNVGDFVFGQDGRPKRVIAKTPIFRNTPCYKVKFADGYEVVVSKDHLWEVGKRSRRRIKGEKHKRHYKDYRVLSTEELAKHSHQPDNRYSVRINQSVIYPQKSLEVDPYVLGVWLGDGTSAGGDITLPDEEIIEKIRSKGFVVNKLKAKYRWGIRGLLTKLKKIKVFKNKHIPKEYLQSSIEQRFELLRGLMDTDGTCDTRHTATFCNINEDLANGVFELAASLGLLPRIRKHKTTFKNEQYYFFQVSFQSYKSFPVFSLSRKLARSSDKERIWRGKSIVSIEPVEPRATSCIQIEDTNGLYLIGKNFTTTHNSSILTTAKIIQKICNNPEERICIFSYTRDLAQAFLRSVKQLMENDELLLFGFRDIFYHEPTKESPLWSIDKGIIVKRRGNFKEATVEAWGLMEGMPTGRHFTGRIYDDVETMDIVNTPELIEKVKYAFDMSHNVGSEGDWHCVHGTYYHHDGLLQYIRKSKDIHGKNVYQYRVKPATEDGTANGKPVLLSQEDLDKLKMLSTFASQQLCDPTPTKEIRLRSSLLKEVGFEEIPTNLIKFISIDSAGIRSSDSREGDSWAILCVGFEPKMDDLGASNAYILDATISPLPQEEAFREIVSMYCRNGRIRKLGVEKVGLSSVEIHIINALRARNKIISVENETLVLLRPGGINKQQRIVNALEWPLNNGKIHMSKAVPVSARERLRAEMDKFPYGTRDDGIDALSYAFHMAKNYRFSKGELPQIEQRPEDKWSRAFAKAREQRQITTNGWMKH